MLVLPPSFPYGGMENPRLSFITPTVIVGDKSLVSLIAHELAHSWSGNLVTFATPKDQWLNECVTSYVVNRFVLALSCVVMSYMEPLIARHDLYIPFVDIPPLAHALSFLPYFLFFSFLSLSPFSSFLFPFFLLFLFFLFLLF